MDQVTSIICRQYCTRRMRRLRRSLKFLHWEQGKGKSKFVQKVISAGMAIDSRLPKILSLFGIVTS
jgi:hypothetical protein